MLDNRIVAKASPEYSKSGCQGGIRFSLYKIWGIPFGMPPFLMLACYRSNDTERVREVMIPNALCTQCLRCIPFSCDTFLPLFRYRAVPRRPDLTDRVRDENINGDSPLAAGVAAVIVAAAATPIVVITAAAAAGDQQDQDDDPPAVVAAKPIVTTHRYYLRNLLKRFAAHSMLFRCTKNVRRNQVALTDFGHCIIPPLVVICLHYTNKRRKCL